MHPGMSATRPALHGAMTGNGLFVAFILASLPAMLIGVWRVGAALLEASSLASAADSVYDAFGWRGWLVQQVDEWPTLAAFALGATFVVPHLLLAVAVAGVWRALFARTRGQPLDASWLMHAWLFVCLLPPSASLPVAAAALSFGLVVGSHIFGGSGRYLVSPALLGILFMHLSYPTAG